MSKIQAEIIKACDLDKPGSNRQSFLKDAIKAISSLSDKEWNALSEGVQNWFNSAADVADANKAKGKSDPFPDFPDFEQEKEEVPARRRTSSKEEPESTIKIGTQVTIIKKSGREITGKLVERDKDVVVLEVDGKEKEIDFDEIGSIESVNDGKGKEEEARGPRAGDTVTFTTKRGKQVEGKLVELTDDTVIVEVDGTEDDYSLSRIEGDIKVVGGSSKAKKEEEPASSRRRASSDDKDEKSEKTKDDGEKKRVSNDGVSIGQRIRELIVDNLDASEAEITKMLQKEKLEFRENTVKLNYAEAHKMLKLLKEKKLLKT